jgi:succinyl-CoA synthetase beta subunit
MANSAEEAFVIAKEIKASNPKAELVLKAQIHAGGRGKGHFDNGFKGGVKICTKPEEVKEYASKMLGARLITKQTGPEGQMCSKVLVNEGINIHRELYFAILMDRKYGGPVLVASTQGGMDIEEVAEKSPDAILTEPVDIVVGVTDAQAKKLADKLGFQGDLSAAAQKQIKSLYNLFMGTDATQVEINPLAEGSIAGGDGKRMVFAVDAKLNFDDNAAFRQVEVYQQRDKSMEDSRDVAAEEAGLNYIGELLATSTAFPAPSLRACSFLTATIPLSFSSLF